jgi:hypothetical protein
MSQVKFGIRFTVNDYAYSELDNFIDCADNLEGPDNLTVRYIEFIKTLMASDVKPSTLVDIDVLSVFIDDLYNRALIDFIERHDDGPDIISGGRMFMGRYAKLKEVHGIDSPLESV